ncbi:UNVERIFIED_CONTAM: hypothetical protein Slati_1454500 [Sesamum latifolium]|uniref:Gag protein n=1 Tax=Sesamum latifolium TaxID=2727402 RepID=A0AAW2X7S1_9LAMI
MQTRSRARDLEANEEVMQEQNQGNREDLQTRGGGSLNQPPQAERGQENDRGGIRTSSGKSNRTLRSKQSKGTLPPVILPPVIFAEAEVPPPPPRIVSRGRMVPKICPLKNNMGVKPPHQEHPLREEGKKEIAWIGGRGERTKPSAIEGKTFPEFGMSPNVKQEQESLRDYVQRFLEVVLEVSHLNHELLASILQQGLRRGRFRESIAGKPPTTLDELLKRAAKYIRIEEALKPKVDTGNKRKTREGERKDPRREGLAEEQRHMPPDGFTKYTPLKAPRAAILTVAEQQGLV